MCAMSIARSSSYAVTCISRASGIPTSRKTWKEGMSVEEGSFESSVYVPRRFHPYLVSSTPLEGTFSLENQVSELPKR
jgi:hypothetical protein